MTETAIDLFPIKCYCGNSVFHVDSENLSLICVKCNNRISIDAINVTNNYIEICVKDTCVLMLPINQQIVELMNELAYYASDSNTNITSTSTPNITSSSTSRSSRSISSVKVFASMFIISLWLFLFFIELLNLVLNVFPLSVIAMIFLVVLVASFFLSLLL